MWAHAIGPFRWERTRTRRSRRWATWRVLPYGPDEFMATKLRRRQEVCKRAGQARLDTGFPVPKKGFPDFMNSGRPTGPAHLPKAFFESLVRAAVRVRHEG